MYDNCQLFICSVVVRVTLQIPRPTNCDNELRIIHTFKAAIETSLDSELPISHMPRSVNVAVSFLYFAHFMQDSPSSGDWGLINP